jgi:cytochrome d ubiquinol oxidase subunit II
VTLADVLIAVTWIGVTLYALLAGADFGAGLWDLLAGGTRAGYRERARIAESISPVWEANHVWLIFVLVVLWTAFPLVFASVASTLYIPLTLVAVGIIARGAAFAFRKSVPSIAVKRLFGGAFAISSVLTPFFLGTVAGAVASGRVPPGYARGDIVTSWLNPTSILGGVLAVTVCAYLAAVYLTADATRARERDLAERFRGEAITAGLIAGAITIAGIFVLRSDAPDLFAGLTGRALPLVIVSAVAGLASLALLVWRRYTEVRLTAGVAVAAVIWGWAVAQYPYMLQGSLTIEDAAADRAVLTATLASLAVGAILLIPSLLYLFHLFQRERRTEPTIDVPRAGGAVRDPSSRNPSE